MTIQETYSSWKDGLKDPDLSIFYYHRDLDRIMLSLAIFIIASRPLKAKLGKAEMLTLLNIYASDLITAWIDENEEAFNQMFSMTMPIAEMFVKICIAAENQFPAHKKTIRHLAYLYMHSCGLGGDMSQRLADKLLDNLTTDGRNIDSEEIAVLGSSLLSLTRKYGKDIPPSLMYDIMGV